MKVISFLASHGGSSAKAIIKACLEKRLPAIPGIVITNNRDSAIYHWCLENEIDVRHISSKSHRGEENADEAIATVLQDANTDWVACSGYMKKVGPEVLQQFPNHILNIHPALLPKHGGQGLYGDHVHEAVLAAHEKTSGASVHLVNEAFDEGQIITQQTVPVYPTDSIEELRSRVQAEESELYIRALNQVLSIQ